MGEYEKCLSIEKNNKLKIINNKTYLNFYKYFYLKRDVIVQNKEINKKDFVVIDLTSTTVIIKQMEFNKGSIFYDYVTYKYNNISLEEKDKFYQEFLKQIDLLKESLKVDYEIVEEDNIDKVIIQNIDININFDNLFETALKVLNEIVKENVTKIYIIFYNSRLLNIKLDSDNYYLFDVNQYLDINECNLLFCDDIYNLNFSSLINYVENIWPKNYEDNEIKLYLNHYFKYLIYLNEFDTLSIEIYLIGLILNKLYGLNQKINCKKPILDNVIKSFVDKF